MKKLLLATVAAVSIMATAAQAKIIDVVSYDTPDAASFNSITTDGYSYYTGPLVLNLNDGTSLTVYCADLNHVLQPGYYEYGTLDTNGLGTPLNTTLSSRLGALAAAGIADLAASDYADAAAVQAAIWDLEYGVTSTGVASLLSDEAVILSTIATGNGARAIALIPYGQGWPGNPSASQQLILGDGPTPTAVVEPASIAMFGIGMIGLASVRRRRA